MTETPMSVGEFSDTLDRLGANLESWPATTRAAAEMLLASSPAAADRLAEAVALAEAMTDAQPKAPEGLVDRIMAASGATKT